MLLVPLLDPAGVGGRHCLPDPEKLIANHVLTSAKLTIIHSTPLISFCGIYNAIEILSSF